MDVPELGSGWHDRFNASPYRLRFELGGEEFDNTTQSVPRFIQAFDRARLVADRVFPDTDPLIAIIGFWKLRDELFYRPRDRGKTGLDMLKMTGFDGGTPLATWRAKRLGTEHDEESRPISWTAFDMSKKRAMRDVLIWSSITIEMPVEPSALVHTYLYNPQAEIVMHIYDDRGMDVTGLTGSPLMETYYSFDKWLLDYDRPRMAAPFGTNPA